MARLLPSSQLRPGVQQQRTPALRLASRGGGPKNLLSNVTNCFTSFASRRGRRRRQLRAECTSTAAGDVRRLRTPGTSCHRCATCVPSSQFWPLLGSITKLTTCCWSTSWKSSCQEAVKVCGRWYQRRRQLGSARRCVAVEIHINAFLNNVYKMYENSVPRSKCQKFWGAVHTWA